MWGHQVEADSPPPPQGESLRHGDGPLPGIVLHPPDEILLVPFSLSGGFSARPDLAGKGRPLRPAAQVVQQDGRLRQGAAREEPGGNFAVPVGLSLLPEKPHAPPPRSGAPRSIGNAS